MAHSPDCAPLPCWIVSEEGRNAGDAKITCPARRWKRPASPAVDAEMMELHLRLRPGQHAARPKAVVSRCLSTPGREVRRAWRRRWSRRRCSQWRPAPHARAGEARRSDRGRGQPCSTSPRPSLMASGARMPWPRPRKRALSVSISGLPACPSHLAVDDRKVSRPDLRFGRRASPPRRQDGAEHRPDIRFPRTVLRRPDARCRRPAAARTSSA